MSHFGAVGDGMHDDTAAFEAALQAAATPRQGSQRLSAGARVDVPPGTYVLKRELELHDVLLMGLAAGGWPADGDSMPVLLLDHAGIGLSLYENSSVHGLTFRRSAKYSAHARNGTRQPTIKLNAPGNSISNVKIYAAYDGIVSASPTPGSSNSGRLYVAQVFVVDPVHCGIDIQNTRDAAIVENCHVWCPATNRQTKFGYRFGGNDGIRCSKLFAANCETGFQLYASTDGTSFWGSFEDCGADLAGTAIDIADGSYISITGGTFLCHHNGIIVNAPDAQVTITGGTYKVNAGTALIVKNVRQLSCVGIAARRGTATASALVDLHRGGAITLSESTIDVRAVGIGIRYDNSGRIGSLSIVGNSLTLFQSPDAKPGSDPKAIVADPENSSARSNIVVADNAGITPRPRPPALTFEQLCAAAMHWSKYHGFIAAIPTRSDHAAMVSTGLIGIPTWTAEIRTASNDELEELLEHTGMRLSSPEGRILASNRWALAHSGADGDRYKAGWPTFEQGDRNRIICFKEGVRPVTYRQSDIGNVIGITQRIGRLSSWIGLREKQYSACLPTFEIGANGQMGAFAIQSDYVSPGEQVRQEGLQGWLGERN